MSDDRAPTDQPEYKVGFGNPPLETRFGKGNKFGKGRKTGSKGLKTIVNEAVNQKVPVSSGGKTKKLSRIELAVHQVASKASKGDPKASDKLIALYERYGPPEDEAGPPPEKLERDMAAVRDYLAMQDQLKKASGDDKEAFDG